MRATQTIMAQIPNVPYYQTYNAKIFTTPIYPPSQKVAKTSWTLPLDFQTVCIYEWKPLKVITLGRMKTENNNQMKTIIVCLIVI